MAIHERYTRTIPHLHRRSTPHKPHSIGHGYTGTGHQDKDARSRAPVELEADKPKSRADGVIAQRVFPDADLPTLQRQDMELAPTIEFLEIRILHTEKTTARKIVLTASQYTMEEHVLYHIEQDGTLRVTTLRLIPRAAHQEMLSQRVYRGAFGTNLRDAKVFSELRRHYWWYGLKTNVTQWTRGCLVWTTHSTGRAVRGPLTPIPVAGRFDRIGVDILQLPTCLARGTGVQ